ncbi:MAG: hypothetical protein NT037_07080 [Hyphomicrobiales bacterium]|nr:hypothetical protein [Hyphomicrobiales bacterium]
MNTFRNKISAFLTAAMLMGGAAMTASLTSDTAYAKGNGGGGNGGGNGGNAGSGGAERSDADMYPPRFPSPLDLLRMPGLRDHGGVDLRGVPPPGRIDPGVFDPGRGSPAPRIDPARVPRGGPISPLDPGLFPGLTPMKPDILAPPTVPTRARNVDRNGTVCDPYGVSVRSGIRTCGD